jgi:hypothetical protein
MKCAHEFLVIEDWFPMSAAINVGKNGCVAKRSASTKPRMEGLEVMPCVSC